MIKHRNFKNKIKSYIFFYIAIIFIINAIIGLILDNKTYKNLQKENKIFSNIISQRLAEEIEYFISKSEIISYQISPKDDLKKISKIIKKHQNQSLIDIDLRNIGEIIDKNIYFSWSDLNGYILIDEYEIVEKSIQNKLSINDINFSKKNNYKFIKDEENFILIYRVHDIGYLIKKIQSNKLIKSVTNSIPDIFLENTSLALDKGGLNLKISQYYLPKYHYKYSLIFILLAIAEIFILFGLIFLLSREGKRLVARTFKLNEFQNFFPKLSQFTKQLIRFRKKHEKLCQKNSNLKLLNNSLESDIIKSKEIFHDFMQNHYFKNNNITDIINEVIEISFLDRFKNKLKIVTKFNHDNKNQNIKDHNFFAQKILQILRKSIIVCQSGVIEIITYNENSNIFLQIKDSSFLPIEFREKTCNSDLQYISLQKEIISKNGYLEWKDTQEGATIVIVVPLKEANIIAKNRNIINFPKK